MKPEKDFLQREIDQIEKDVLGGISPGKPPIFSGEALSQAARSGSRELGGGSAADLRADLSFNPAAAFVLFWRLGSLSATAEALDIHYQNLVAYATEQEWNALVEQLPKVADLRPETTQARLKAMENNRAENYRQSDRLRKLVDVWVGAMETALAKAAGQKGGVMKGLPTAKELNDLLKAVQSLHDSTYRALGDKGAADSGSAGNVHGEVTAGLLAKIHATLGDGTIKAAVVLSGDPEEPVFDLTPHPAGPTDGPQGTRGPIGNSGEYAPNDLLPDLTPDAEDLRHE